MSPLERMPDVYRRTAVRGFTLVELVAVLVIVGVMVAVAVPIVTDMRGEARLAAIRHARATLEAQLANVYALAAARDQTGPTGQVVIGGATVNLKYGYPTGGSMHRVIDLPRSVPYAGAGPVVLTNFNAGWNLDGYAAIVMTMTGAEQVYHCWFGYSEATAGSAASLTPIFSESACQTMWAGTSPHVFDYIPD